MFKKSWVILGLVGLISILLSAPGYAENRPIQIALVTPIQIFPEDNSITGVRLNLLYGRNVSVTGLDVGLVNHTTTGKFIGLQYGLVGLSDSDFSGWQDCVVNITNKKFEGFQFGWVNYADYMSGFQLGLVNYAGSAKGLQIGLVNIIRQGGQFPVFPIVNWSF
ncbi:MAG: hypothetical protein ABII96_01400 [Candidatus Zixiibacteriota bacterium]